jgi:multidrug efflux system membrane fusion protein
MLVITQLQPITALFTLPEDQLPAVAAQMRRGPLEVDAYSRDDQTKLANGKLLTIDNQVDQTTGTARLKAVFQNEESQLWPNQFVNVHLLLETRKNVTVVPTAAVQTGPQGSYVYVVKQDNTVEVRPVTVAITEGNLAQIAVGVTPNESVVTDGQDKLQANSHVEPHTQPANPNAGAQNARNSGKGNAYGNTANQGSGNQRPANANPGDQNTDNVQSGNRVGRNRQRGQPQSNPNMGTASQ